MKKVNRKYRLSRMPLRFIPALLLACPTANALDVKLDGRFGVDSNPLELSDSFDPDTEGYWLADAYFRHNFENSFYIKGHVQDAQYSGLSEADWTWSSLTPGYRSDFDLGGKKFQYELSLKYTSYDYTYIDKSTGRPAVFNNRSIDDRFDSTYTNYNVKFTHKTESNTRLNLRLQYREKDYEDISDPGLSDIDYRHNLIAFGAELRPDDKNRFSGELSYTDRDYVDRRADDLDGNDIPGTDLSYEYTTLLLGYRYQPSDKFRLKMSYRLEAREDNASGYWDADTDEFRIETRFQVSDIETLDLQLRLRDKSYDNRVDFDQASVEEESRQTESRRIRLKYTKIVNRLENSDWSYYVELESNDVESSDEDYEHDRYLIAAGVLWATH